MINTRTITTAGALVFFALFAPKAMAAQPESSVLSTIDLSTCVRIGRYHKCILKVEPTAAAAALNAPQVLLSNKQFKALKELPALKDTDTKAARKSLGVPPSNSIK